MMSGPQRCLPSENRMCFLISPQLPVVYLMGKTGIVTDFLFGELCQSNHLRWAVGKVQGHCKMCARELRLEIGLGQTHVSDNLSFIPPQCQEQLGS